MSGILLLTFALMSAVAILTYHDQDPPSTNAAQVHNLLGPAGAYLAYVYVQFTFGRWVSLVLTLLLAGLGLDIMRTGARWTAPRLAAILLPAAVLAAGIIGWIRHVQGLELRFEELGLIGHLFSSSLLRYLDTAGMAIVLVALLSVYLTVLLRVRWGEIFSAIGQSLAAILTTLLSGMGKLKPRVSPEQRREKRKNEQDIPRVEDEETAAEEEEATTIPPQTDPHAEEPLLNRERPGRPTAQTAGHKDGDPTSYQLPSAELLNEEEEEQADELDETFLREQAAQLEQRLAEFGVKARVVAIHPGPVITRYDLKPAPGVKVSRITNLGDDLALSLSADAIRIIAPIPGAGAVGVEVPNPTSRTVYLREIVTSSEFQNAKSPLAIALGKRAQGDEFVVDLAKMPHLLIAGTTGSGKSVCINTIITSLLMRNPPNQVMVAMVDPKKIELSAYQELRRHHLLFLEENDEVIATSPKSAVSLLRSIVQEMESRYDRLAETGARNLVEYNRLVEDGRVRPAEEGQEVHPLPYIVTIIDELADLMLTAAKEVEEPIARLAQMARAVGIHLVVATQRPSVDVITGVIKANFPARMAFMVATKIDSRTILDRPGAETLLGKGDGLFLAGNTPTAVRFHCAFVSTPEVHRMIAHVHNQPMFRKLVELRLPLDESGEGGGPSSSMDDDRDSLFNEAVRIVARHQQGSVSLLQRRLKIGYSRAGRLLDQLEMAGVVGPFEGSKARDVLLAQEDLEAFLESDQSEET